jgi:hypothetical protein
MQNVYGRWIWVRNGKRENRPTRRDWPPRGFEKFTST